MMESLSISVVIPVGPEELSVPIGLIDDLRSLPPSTEVLFVTCNKRFDATYQQQCHERLLPREVRWVASEQGRAVQMNRGAQLATGECLWFLHLDSRFDAVLVNKLLTNVSQSPEKLHYCLLQFLVDGPQAMRLNGWGANLRSWLFGTPFGDQGFAVTKAVFERVGGYPENAAYGEDHLFVWHARQQGVRLKCCREYLKTSARKYRTQGWCYLTYRYQYLWIKQAIPELFKLIKKRYLSARCQR